MLEVSITSQDRYIGASGRRKAISFSFDHGETSGMGDKITIRTEANYMQPTQQSKNHEQVALRIILRIKHPPNADDKSN